MGKSLRAGFVAVGSILLLVGLACFYPPGDGTLTVAQAAQTVDAVSVSEEGLLWSMRPQMPPCALSKSVLRSNAAILASQGGCRAEIVSARQQSDLLEVTMASVNHRQQPCAGNTYRLEISVDGARYRDLSEDEECNGMHRFRFYPATQSRSVLQWQPTALVLASRAYEGFLLPTGPPRCLYCYAGVPLRVPLGERCPPTLITTYRGIIRQAESVALPKVAQGVSQEYQRSSTISPGTPLTQHVCDGSELGHWIRGDCLGDLEQPCRDGIAQLPVLSGVAVTPQMRSPNPGYSSVLHNTTLYQPRGCRMRYFSQAEIGARLKARGFLKIGFIYESTGRQMLGRLWEMLAPAGISIQPSLVMEGGGDEEESNWNLNFTAFTSLPGMYSLRPEDTDLVTCNRDYNDFYDNRRKFRAQWGNEKGDQTEAILAQPPTTPQWESLQAADLIVMSSLGLHDTSPTFSVAATKRRMRLLMKNLATSGFRGVVLLRTTTVPHTLSTFSMTYHLLRAYDNFLEDLALEFPFIVLSRNYHHITATADPKDFRDLLHAKPDSSLLNEITLKLLHAIMAL